YHPHRNASMHADDPRNSNNLRSSDDPHSADESRRLRIGARVVVELLRLKADPPGSTKLVLADARSKNALAVLRDRLLALQNSLPFPAGTPSVSQAVSDACRDLQIPL